MIIVRCHGNQLVFRMLSPCSCLVCLLFVVYILPRLASPPLHNAVSEVANQVLVQRLRYWVFPLVSIIREFSHTQSRLRYCVAVVGRVASKRPIPLRSVDQ